jgi:hypothetical protein
MNSENENSPDGLSETPEAVLGHVGDRLRAAREEMRLELSHIAAETRIPVRHLEAIERGDFGALPSRTYAIGFSKTYAHAVGLDREEIAIAVREELGDGSARQSAVSGGMEPGDATKLPSTGLVWFGALAALILAAGAVAFYSTYFGAGTGPAPLIAENSQSGGDDGEGGGGGGGDGAGDGDGDLGVAGGDETLGANGAEAGAAGEAAPGGQVVFTALEDGVWVRFYEDGGERLFEAEMVTGDRFELPADAVEPRINTGRPDALSITIGGTSVPKLADEAITLGDEPVSAAALLARADTPAISPMQQ